MEIWDLYDRDAKKTGETWERTYGSFRLIPEGKYHMVVDILIKHVDGTYLLTKRHPDKDVYPGYWEASAGGSAVSGEEQLEAAKREMFEETGLKSDNFTLVNHSFSDKSHSMFYSYLAVVDCDKDSVVLQEEETVDYKWVDRDGLNEYINSDLAIQSHNNRYKKYFDVLNTLYVSDLDGTLMKNDKSISEESVKTINDLLLKGITFTVATARSLGSVKHIVEPFDLKAPMIIRNGTAYADPKIMKVTEKALFTKSELTKLKDILSDLPYNGFTSIWNGNEMTKVFAEGKHSSGIDKYIDERKGAKDIKLVSDINELFNGDVGYITMIDDLECMQPIYDKVKESDEWEAVLQKDSYGDEYWLEICPGNSTKAKAILKLKEKMNFEKVVVFGDSVNDIPMFEIADSAYAVENAIPSLKEYATEIIASNEDDGVARFLQNIL